MIQNHFIFCLQKKNFEVSGAFAFGTEIEIELDHCVLCYVFLIGEQNVIRIVQFCGENELTLVNFES
jgi:hypothetical protein